MSYPLLMGLGSFEGGGRNGGMGGELNSLMLAQLFNTAGSGQQNEEMGKQLQRMLMAPIARRFSENLARKIMSLSNEGRARLIASLVTDVMARKQEGDVAAMFDMCAMSGIMGLMNGADTQPAVDISSNDAERPTELGLGTRQLRKIGGSFKGVLESPAEEVKRIQIPQAAERTVEPQKKIRGRL